MKQKLLTLIIIVLTACTFFTGKAQTITVVPNPTNPGTFTWTGYGPLSGYSGTPVVLNNTLVLEYNPDPSSDTAQVRLQLAVYNGTTTTLIANPDAGHGVYFNSVQIVFNNKLYFIYLNASGTQQLASFDGTSITLYPNPDGGLGYVGSPRIYNGELYGAYNNAAGVFQFAKFTGTALSLIPNPDNSGVGFNFNYATVFNNEICARYVSNTGVKRLAVYNGTAWSLLPNPDGTANRGYVATFPIIYHSKLYWEYYSATLQYQYAVWDGISNPTLLSNPQNSATNNGGISGFPIIYNDTLFFDYYSTSNTLQLAKTGGTTISLVPNPDNTTYGFYNTPIVYNNNLYLFYVTPDGLHHLGQYETALDSLKIYANPDGGLGYWDQPIVYDNNLYFMYYNASSIFQLGYFNGTSLHLIANPGGVYNGATGNNGYTGFPIIFNTLLYMQFGSVPYGNAGNLAHFDGAALPVTFLNFDGVLQNDNAQLTWRTANEINNKGFDIEKSMDGHNFKAIGFVAGHGNSSNINSYNFTDIKVLSGSNYYRLKQINNDGVYTYSSAIKLDYSKFDWTVVGNPVTSNTWVQVQIDKAANVSIQVLSMTGNLLKTISKGNIEAGTYSIPLNLDKASSGMYIVKLVVDGKSFTKKVVK